MLNNIIQKIKEQRLSVIFYSLGMILYVWMIAGMFPSIEKFDFAAYFEAMPKLTGKYHRLALAIGPCRPRLFGNGQQETKHA